MSTEAAKTELNAAVEHLHNEMTEAARVMGENFANGPGMFNVRSAVACIEAAIRQLDERAQ